MPKTTNWATANATATWLLETGRSGTCSNIIVPNRASNIQHPTFYCRKLLPLGVFALAGGNLGWVGGKVIAIVISQRSKSNCLHCLACLAKMHTVAQTFVGTRSQSAEMLSHTDATSIVLPSRKSTPLFACSVGQFLVAAPNGLLDMFLGPELRTHSPFLRLSVQWRQRFQAD